MSGMVEWFVSSGNMDTIRSHKWEPQSDGELLSTVREWTWNYRLEQYSERRNTQSMTITPDGTVEHDGRPLEEYAKARVKTLTDKRGVHNPTVERVQ